MAITLSFYDPHRIKDTFFLTVIPNCHLTDLTSKRNSILYFDTVDHDLYKAGIRFYAMEITKGWLIAITGEDASTVSGTWGVNGAKLPMPILNTLLDEKIKGAVGKIIGHKPLVELMKLDYSQHSGIMETDTNKRIRITYDQGKIVVGKKVEFVSEVCLDPLDATDADVAKIAAKIAAGVPVYVEMASKYQRGLYLAGLRVEAREAIVNWESAQNGLQDLLVKQIERIFTAQKLFIKDTSNPETLHQLRVQIRRLRVYLQLAGPLLNTEEYLQWRGYFRTLGNSMNRLRDTDVLIDLCHEITSFISLDGKNKTPLEIILQTNRGIEVEDVKSALLSGQPTTMLLRFTIWLNENAFLSEARGLDFKKFTIKRLQKWIGRMQELGKELDTKTMLELHQLRIIGKKVRYAIEGLELDRNNRILKNLKLLQENLGNIHDAAVQAETLEKLISDHTDLLMNRNIGILVGWTARMKYESQQKLNKDWIAFCYTIGQWQKYVKK